MLVATVTASIEYYRQVRKAQKEYEKAKGIVEDIILSFNRELKRESDKLELVAFKVEGNSSKADASLRRIESIGEEDCANRRSNHVLYHRLEQIFPATSQLSFQD